MQSRLITLTTDAPEKHLSLWEEIVGVCSKIREEDSKIVIFLRSDKGMFKILLCRDFFESIKLNELLKKIQGRKIGILRTDDPKNPYVIRIIKASHKFRPNTSKKQVQNQ